LSNPHENRSDSHILGWNNPLILTRFTPFGQDIPVQECVPPYRIIVGWERFCQKVRNVAQSVILTVSDGFCSSLPDYSGVRDSSERELTSETGI